MHAALGSRRHWHDPKKGEILDELFGSLGQIAVRQALLGWGFVVSCAPLFTDRIQSLPNWDLAVPGTTIEVKTIPPDDGVVRCRMLVKVSEVKKVDVYVAVKFTSDIDFYFAGWATSDEVMRYPIRDRGYAPAHEKLLSELRPIADLKKHLIDRSK
jgi:hypothetical protein